MESLKKNSYCEKIPAIRIIVAMCVNIGKRGFHWRQTRVSGPYWRIYWNDTPGAFITAAGKEVELTPDRIIVLAPDTVYSTRIEKESRHFYVHCFIAQPFSEIISRMFVWENEGLVRMASNLADKVNESMDKVRTQLELQVYLNSILLAIPPDNIQECVTNNPKIAKAINILENVQKISNEELAQQVGMSRNGFLFLFKKVVGSSPQAYSRQFRTNQACIMLQGSDKSIDEIAQETGFCDRYHFSRVFRQTIGYSPVQFRQINTPGHQANSDM
jgi:AraC-like DNA-binding protein